MFIHHWVKSTNVTRDLKSTLTTTGKWHYIITAQYKYPAEMCMFTALLLFYYRPWVKCIWPESLPFEPKGLNFSVEVTFYDSMLPVYQRLFAEENLRILVYNGEADPTVTHIGMYIFFQPFFIAVTKCLR